MVTITIPSVSHSLISLISLTYALMLCLETDLPCPTRMGPRYEQGATFPAMKGWEGITAEAGGHVISRS